VIKIFENEEAKARYWAVKIQPQWVVTPGKQTNNMLQRKDQALAWLLHSYIFT
jgi:hypothetical protein